MHAHERTALITGASRGLGRALARGLAGRGWNLILTARNAEQLAALRDELAQRTHVAAIPGDVTDDRHRGALAILVRGHGGLDALVNNAGALGPSPRPPLFDYPLDALRSVLEANVLAPLGMLQAVRETLKPGARVLSITSDAATTPYPGWGGYGASKAALELLAHEPPEARGIARDEVRLLVSWTDTEETRHARFLESPEYLQRGDLLVVNTSATINASLPVVRGARVDEDSAVRLHLSTQLSSTHWVVELRRVTLKGGAPLLDASTEELLLLPGGAEARLVEPWAPARHSGAIRLWIASLDLP